MVQKMAPKGPIYLVTCQLSPNSLPSKCIINSVPKYTFKTYNFYHTRLFCIQYFGGKLCWISSKLETIKTNGPIYLVVLSTVITGPLTMHREFCTEIYTLPKSTQNCTFINKDITGNLLANLIFSPGNYILLLVQSHTTATSLKSGHNSATLQWLGECYLYTNIHHSLQPGTHSYSWVN